MTKSNCGLPNWPLPPMANQLTDNLMMYFMYNKYKGCSFQSVRGWQSGCERESEMLPEGIGVIVFVYVFCECASNQYAQVQSLFDVHNKKE